MSKTLYILIKVQENLDFVLTDSSRVLLGDGLLSLAHSWLLKKQTGTGERGLRGSWATLSHHRILECLGWKAP